MERLMIAGMLAAVLAGAPAAEAQDEVAEALQECREIPEAGKRLACFDALADQFGSRRKISTEPAEAASGVPDAGDERVAAEPAGPDDGEASPKAPAPEEETATKEAESEVASSGPADREAAPAPSRSKRVTTADDLSLPYEGRIKAFAANARGDYRFRISEGILFKRAGGPGLPSADLTGSAVTLSKNFLGQWRARVEGQPRELWVSPVGR